MMPCRGLVLLHVIVVLVLRSATGVELAVTIDHRAGDNPLILESLRYESEGKETYSVTRLSYLLSGFALQKEDGVWVELEERSAWLDVEKKRTGFRLREVPEGDYRALRFRVGLDQKTNSSDPAKYPPDHPLNGVKNRLHWTWETGYVFLAMEGKYRHGDELKGYVFHLARDGNQAEVNLEVPLKMTKSRGLRLTFDVSSLLNSPKGIVFEKDGNSTHSMAGDPLVEKLKVNLTSAFRVLKSSEAAAEEKKKLVKPLYLPEKFTPYRFKMSKRFPMPDLPRDNPLTEERVKLGDLLFHDASMSIDNNISCAACHVDENAFSDPRKLSLGWNGERTLRNSMPLFNLAWKKQFFWDGRAGSLREQVLMPIQDPVEMHQNLKFLPRKLARNRDYPPLFKEAFGSPEITTEKIALALENFLLTMTSYDSKFDRAMTGEVELTKEEQRGFEVFFTEWEPRLGKRGGDCFHCHGGPFFSDFEFHDIGLFDAKDRGLARVTKKETDRGKFVTPSLRNVALTAPYMHDGRFKTLEEVVDHYDLHKIRSANLDPNLAKHSRDGMGLTAEDKKAIVAFLKTLTDPKYVFEE